MVGTVGKGGVMNSYCVACGLKMNEPGDHATSDPSKPYCHRCARPDGRMKSYDEVFDNVVRFLTDFQNLEMEQAREVARKMMARRPAWRKHSGD